MRFNLGIFTSATLTASILLASTGCGMLGTKNPIELANKEVGGGCLNETKTLFNRYAKGQVSDTEWKSAFDCVGQSLDFFMQYVQGSSPDAYSQQDMYTFVSKFLITNNKVNPELLRGAFQLKAALLGGTAAEFKKEEVETFKAILPRVRDITSELIPFLRVQNSGSTNYADYLESAEAFKRAGEQLSDLVNSLPVGMLSEKSVTLLFQQLAESLNMQSVDGLSAKMFIAKWILFNSRPDAIEAQDWGQIVKSALTFGGYALAVLNAPSGSLAEDYRYREFMWEIAQRIRPLLTDSVNHHGGAIPLPLIDRMIDELPIKEKLDVRPAILKQALRPLFRKLFQSDTKIGIDLGVINTFYDLGNNWVKNMGLLDRMYEMTGIDKMETPAAVMQNAVDQYAASLTKSEDQVRFAKVSHDIMTYIPQFYRDTMKVRFQRGSPYSKFQHLFVITGTIAAELLHKTYGSGDDYFVKDDFNAVYDDFKDLLFALKMIDITVVDWPGKRFTELNLFTPIGNGDAKATVPEILYYAMVLVSAGTLKMEMYHQMAGSESIPALCNTNLGDDLLEFKWIAASCFRTQFNDRLDQWMDNFPNLHNYWAKLNPDQRKKAMIWLEHGARRNGYNDDDFASFDFTTMPTVLHYAESLFQRFNGTDSSDILTREQILNAFPVFQTLLAEHAKMPPTKTKLLLGIFTYIVHYREMPDTTSARGIAKLLWWVSTWKVQKPSKVSTDRLGIYNIICLLGLPESKKQQDLTPQICKP